MDSEYGAIGWGIDPANYPLQEGTFFGNIIMTGDLSSLGMPDVTRPAAYFCEGNGFANGVVAGPHRQGRLANAPYVNPFGNAALQRQRRRAVHLRHRRQTGSRRLQADLREQLLLPERRPDHGVAERDLHAGVRRGLRYRMSPMRVRQVDRRRLRLAEQRHRRAAVRSWDGDPQKFNILSSGSNWKIAMTANNNKCLNPVGTARRTGRRSRSRTATAAATRPGR